jgi:hypothetical protein
LPVRNRGGGQELFSLYRRKGREERRIDGTIILAGSAGYSERAVLIQLAMGKKK